MEKYRCKYPKKTKIALLSLAFSFLIVSSTWAQSKWQFAGAIAHGNKAESFGLHLRPTYLLFEKLHVAPSVTMYSSADLTSSDTQRFTEFNADAFYMVDSDDSLFQPYLLAGLNFSRRRIENDLLRSISKRTRQGVNIGAGVNFRLLKRFAPFAEARYTIGGFGQFEIMAGVKI